MTIDQQVAQVQAAINEHQLVNAKTTVTGLELIEADERLGRQFRNIAALLNDHKARGERIAKLEAALDDKSLDWFSLVDRITQERDALRSRWQPIDTAPKDRQRILLTVPEHEGMSVDGPVQMPPSVHIGYWNPEGSAWVDECNSFDGDADHLANTGVWNSQSGWFQPNEVTHWMPLPEPAAKVLSETASGESRGGT